VELCTELLYAIIPTLFLCFCWSAIPKSCYIFNVFFILVHVPFFNSRCMLELKFAIYYRAASLLSQASYAVLAEESLTRPGFFKHTPHTNSISNLGILRNNYISLPSDLCACVHVKKKWHHKGSHGSSVSGFESPCVTLNPEKSNGLHGALLSEKCCCFVRKPL